MWQYRDRRACRQATGGAEVEVGAGEQGRCGPVWAGGAPSLGLRRSRWGRKRKTERTGSQALAVAAPYAQALRLSREGILPGPSGAGPLPELAPQP